MDCINCKQPISKDRIEAFVEFRNEYPETCTKCSKEQRVIGFMGESTIGGDKAGRKNGYTLVTINPNSVNYKENIRRAKRCHERAR
jgi:NAD-dependent SIR2 family protein deacetylase